MRQALLAMIRVPLTTKRVDGAPQYAIGTGYPIREGLVLTARHVLYPENRDETAKPQLSWCMQDKGEPYHTDPMGEVVYEHKQYDLALIRCKTPTLTETVHLAAQVLRSNEDWESLGYPNGGKDDEGVRSKTPADGKVKSDTGGHVRHLDVSDHVPPEIWQGMSGAPVFKLHSNTLLGVWTHGNRDFPDRIMMTELAVVLAGKCEGFRQLALQTEVATQLLPKPKLQDEFRQYLLDKLSKELMGLRSTSLLQEQLAAELDVELEGVVLTSTAAATALATALVDKSIEDALSCLAAATADCVVDGGLRFSSQTTSDTLAAIKRTAQTLVGWLVIASMDENYLREVLPDCSGHASLFFRLKSVQSKTGIEIVLARRFQRKADFVHETGSDQPSRYLIRVPPSFFKWDGETSVSKAFVEIWNQVFPEIKEQKPKDYKLNHHEIKRLNAELRAKRKHLRSPEHYYIAFTGSDYLAPECVGFVEGIYRDLLSQLGEMTVIEYGTESEQDSRWLLVPEADIQAAINSFYNEINGLN